MVTSLTRIRRADLDADRDGILAVLKRNLPEAASPERFDWLYRSNPDGDSLVWVAEAEDGSLVGTSAAHPRRLRIEGRIVTALVLSDFALDAGLRTLGPALKLLKATLAPVREGEYPLSYDFPSASMHAIYRRLGSPDLGSTVRFVRPIRLSGAIRRRFGRNILSSAAGSAADSALRLRDAVRPGGDHEVADLEGPFDERFDRLDAMLAADRTAAGVRDARYLDWKYRRHAMWPNRTLVSTRDGELTGFAVFRPLRERAWSLVDLAANSEAARRALIAALVRLGRIQGQEQIETEALDEPGNSRMLEGLGFVRRESGVGPVPYFAPECPARDKLIRSEEWWLNGGDRDI